MLQLLIKFIKVSTPLLKLEHGREGRVKVIADEFDPQLLAQQVFFNLIDSDVQSLNVH